MDQSDDDVTILHVDDSPELAGLVAAFLERENPRFEVETVADVAEGLDRLSSGRVDCVVSDYEMPGRDGIDFLEAVREEYGDLPFVLFTGRGTERVASDAISAGVTDYLQKEGGSAQYAVLANRIENAVEHHRSQRSLERSERRLREIVDALPHFLYVVDEDGTYDLANRPLAEFHGRSVAEIEGTAVDDVLDEAAAERFRADVSEVLSSGEPKHVPEFETTDRSGSRRVFDPRLFPYDLTDRRAVLGTAVDVTEQREREERLNALTEQFRTLHDATRALVRADDRETVAHLVTDAVSTIFEYPRSAVRLVDGDVLRPVAVSDLTRDELGDRPVYRIGEGLPGEVFQTGESRIVDDFADVDDGIDRSPHRSAMYLPIGDHGTLTVAAREPRAFEESDCALASVLVNNAAAVLDRQEGQRELERQNERLAEFASVVSHDLRNPLNVASGRVELARAECDSEHLDAVERAVDRMEALVEDLLELTRGTEGLSRSDSVVLTGVVEDCWDTVETGPATLVVDLDLTVPGVENRLKQLFENLFRNAVEHGTATGEEPPADGTADRSLTVRVGECEGGFYVEDDGRGIPPEDRETVFESGYSTASNGTGFGLGIVRQVADEHGWDVALTESDAGGVRFEFGGVTE